MSDGYFSSPLLLFTLPTLNCQRGTGFLRYNHSLSSFYKTNRGFEHVVFSSVIDCFRGSSRPGGWRGGVRGRLGFEFQSVSSCAGTASGARDIRCAHPKQHAAARRGLGLHPEAPMAS
jgi:hypothetical protein